MISVPSTSTAVSALVRRDFLVARSYRLAFALDLFYGLLDLLLYYFISRTFGGTSMAHLQGAPSYFDFAAVGVILGAVLTATSASVGYQMRQEQLTGTLEALSAEPVTPVELCLGLVGFPFAFASLRAAFYLLLAAVWLGLDVSNASWPGLVLVLIASGVAIAPIGILAGAAVLTFKRGETVAGTTMFLLTFLSGMVFPISSLPAWLEPIARIVPLRFAFDGARKALFIGSGWGLDVLVLVLWAVVLWPLALFLFSRAFAHAKRAGTLAQY